jgi:hypothetical protein
LEELLTFIGSCVVSRGESLVVEMEGRVLAELQAIEESRARGEISSCSSPDVGERVLERRLADGLSSTSLVHLKDGLQEDLLQKKVLVSLGRLRGARARDCRGTTLLRLFALRGIERRGERDRQRSLTHQLFQAIQ